jgi:raffinose/stachyose/melibiose transport system permease protein
MSAHTISQKQRLFGNSRVLNHIALSLLVVFSLGPLVILVFNSFKTTPQISQNPLSLPPELRWENYASAWEAGNFAVTMRNSLFLVVTTVLGVWAVAGLAAYSLARLNPPGANFITIYLVTGGTLPIQVTIFVLFVMMSKVNLTNSLLGLFPLYVAGGAPFATFLLRSFMVAIPQEIDDAARVDGANYWQIFWRIILPITWPGFLTVGLITALGVWNEFFVATTFIRNPELRTVATGLHSFISSARFQDWGLAHSAAVIMLLPVIVIFLLLQRRFIEGLTQGGVKM